ncbi:MAG: kinase/pyrophosphorylase [Oligoflexia bacterium]|nr:kinase/pyrophosphorylase [Oligoflexia bacterium]
MTPMPKIYHEIVYIYPEGTTEASHRHIYILSDGTAATCESVLISCLCQFQGVSVTIHKIPDVSSKQQLSAIFKEASFNEGMVIYTFVNPELTDTIYNESITYAVPSIDILGQIFTRLEELLKLSPMGIPGLLRKSLDNEYFRRIAAIDFGVKHDDGLGLDSIQDAEIIILGISRSSKTPISIYLSYRGLRVANYPLIMGIPLPKEIIRLPREKFIGLIIAPSRLLKIRENRFNDSDTSYLEKYLSLHEIEHELQYAKKIYNSFGCPIVDVTLKSIEEVATEIMNLQRERSRKNPL